MASRTEHLAIGSPVELGHNEMAGLVDSGILTLTVQGMQLTAQKAAGSVPELIEVRSHSGYELTVDRIEGGTWYMEVTKQGDISWGDDQ